MKLTAELSLYPLQQDYISVIKEFIAAAHKHGGIDIVSLDGLGFAPASTARTEIDRLD